MLRKRKAIVREKEIILTRKQMPPSYASCDGCKCFKNSCGGYTEDLCNILTPLRYKGKTRYIVC